MRKTFLMLIISIISSGIVLADEWDDFSAVNKAWDNQKTFTNQDFEQVMDVLEEKKAAKDEKQQKKKFKKIIGGGTSLHSELDPKAEIIIQDPVKKNEDGALVNIPVNIIIDEQVLEKGFYKIIAQKDENGDVYLLFYQSQFFKGKVRATETKDDFGEEEIDFAKMLPYNDSFVKIIFGSIDINAYAYILYKHDVL